MQSERTRMAVASVDHAIGLIVENLKQTHRMDSTTVIVCGDHGFSDISQAIAPNVWLTRAGLLSEKPGGDWKACFHGNGSVMFLYLRDSNDKKLLKRLRISFRIFLLKRAACSRLYPKRIDCNGGRS